MAFRDVLPGLYEPAPPLHVPVVAPPVMVPARVTKGLDEHTLNAGPALVVTALFIEMITLSETGTQGPVGSFVVSVRVTVPELISAAVGVYTAFKVDALGEKVPDPPLHVAAEAAPPITPASVTFGLVAQTTWSIFALTVAAGFIVISI